LQTYYINQVFPDGHERAVLKTEANSVEVAWLGSMSWFLHGTFYVYPKDNYAAGMKFSKD